MDFDFREEERTVAELARKILEDGATNERLKELEASGRQLRYSLHVEGREGYAAAKLCRGAVKELALLHASLAQGLQAMEVGYGGGAATGWQGACPCSGEVPCWTYPCWG